MLVRIIFILLPDLVWWCSSVSQSVMQRNFVCLFCLLLSSRLRSQLGLIWSKCDFFYYIFWTVDSLGTKLGLMIHHHKPDCFYHIWWTADLFATRFNWMGKHHKLECLVLKLDCCFQGQVTVMVQNLLDRAPVSWSKGCEFESRQEWRENFLL